MTIYDSTDYRTAIKDLLKNRKSDQPGYWSAQRLAAVIGVHKSYLSAVFGLRSHLNPDQLFLVCKAFKLNSREIRHLNLLSDWEKTIVPERREQLFGEIQKHKQEGDQVHAKLIKLRLAEDSPIMARYYLEPPHQIVHMALSVPRFAADPAEFAQSQALTKRRLKEVLNNLCEMDLAKSTGRGSYSFRGRNLHLASDNPLYRGYQRALRQVVIDRLGAEPDEFGFSAVFSADIATYRRLREKWLELITEMQREIAKAPPEKIFQMNVDIVSWA